MCWTYQKWGTYIFYVYNTWRHHERSQFLMCTYLRSTSYMMTTIFLLRPRALNFHNRYSPVRSRGGHFEALFVLFFREIGSFNFNLSFNLTIDVHGLTSTSTNFKISYVKRQKATWILAISTKIQLLQKLGLQFVLWRIFHQFESSNSELPLWFFLCVWILDSIYFDGFLVLIAQSTLLVFTFFWHLWWRNLTFRI